MPFSKPACWSRSFESDLGRRVLLPRCRTCSAALRSPSTYRARCCQRRARLSPCPEVW
jgi:hypothetical protein